MARERRFLWSEGYPETNWAWSNVPLWENPLKWFQRVTVSSLHLSSHIKINENKEEERCPEVGWGGSSCSCVLMRLFITKPVCSHVTCFNVFLFLAQLWVGPVIGTVKGDNYSFIQPTFAGCHLMPGAPPGPRAAKITEGALAYKVLGPEARQTQTQPTNLTKLRLEVFRGGSMLKLRSNR